MPRHLPQAPSDVLYRYLSCEQFRRQTGYPHPDPMIDEFTYGEGAAFCSFVWNHIAVGSRLFFHTMVGGERYLTAMYRVSDLAPAPAWRADKAMRQRFRNPHLHPEEHREWWGHDDFDNPWEAAIRDAWAEGEIPRGTDVVIIGDPDASIDIRKSPIVLGRDVMGRLDLRGKPVKWGIIGKNGKVFDDRKCINACLRPPRLLSSDDGDYLEDLVRRNAGLVRDDASQNAVYAIDPFVASRIHLNCITEEEIESLICRDLNAVEKGLRLVGRQVRLDDGGRMDILARTEAGAPVVIEVKKGTADDGVLAQLISYMHQYKKQARTSDPIGKIVCADASYRLRMACEHAGIQIHCYGDVFAK